VWWDQFALDLGVESVLGIRRESRIMKDVPASIVADGVREYEKWRTLREQGIANGSAPSIAVRTATEWAAGDDRTPSPPPGVDALQPGLFDEPPISTTQSTGAAAGRGGIDVAIVDARGSERPGGARFGELVHAILASTALDADAPAIAALAEVHGRIVSALAEETAAAALTVQHVLAHPVLGRARAAEARGACRRETPVTLVAEDGTLVEGDVDLAFEETEGWTIVDYKTDRELRTIGEEQYRRQVQLYAAAIAQATGRSATGVIVRL
jgi:hypothetical protein